MTHILVQLTQADMQQKNIIKLWLRQFYSTKSTIIVNQWGHVNAHIPNINDCFYSSRPIQRTMCAIKEIHGSMFHPK